MGARRLYKAGTPYNAVDLAELDYAQTADVVYFAHIDYPPQKLVRAGHTNWTFGGVAFQSPITAPVGLTATPTQPNTTGAFPINAQYVVSAVKADGTVSRASTAAAANNDLALRGNFNTVTWTAHADAAYYLVYKSENGGSSFGFLANADTNSFVDGNGGIIPEYADGPRVGENPFASVGNYPSSVALHQQRLWWGRARNKPNLLAASQVADFENMDRSRPGKADDALQVGIVSERVNAVNHIASMKSLIALTSDAIFVVNGGTEGSAITAQQVVSTRQVGRGSERLKPIVIDNVLLFRPNQGSSVRALGYTFEIDGYKSDNLAIFSPHFFEGYEIVSWDYQQEPFACVWAVRNDGRLLCLTWEQEQQVWGWTLCETTGFVEQVAVITEEGIDRAYLAVRRTLAGGENVFVERMALPLLVAEDLNECCYLDCAVTQRTVKATDTITGLWHLEGETVTAFADGYVVEELTVTNGRVVLDFDASTITVGLPYSGEIETLPLAMSGDRGTANADRQMMESVVVRVKMTRGLKVGTGGEGSNGDLFEIKQRETEELDQPIALKTRDFEAKLGAQWNNGATIRVVQDFPLPATVTALLPKVKVTK